MGTAHLHLKPGTYIRQLDGATLTWHNTALFNSNPHENFANYSHEWRIVHDEDELRSIQQWFGSWLRPGEYGEINAMELRSN